LRTPLRNFILLLGCLSLSSCVSVKLAPEVEKSTRTVFTPPAGFVEAKIPPADQAWKSPKTGNTISYFSECGNLASSLEQTRDDVLATLPKSKLISSQTIEHDEREALDSLLEGKVEGIPIKMALFLYQKNGCRYSLSYTGRKSLFDQELEQFRGFQKGFRAP
jgi:hypothetical protein